MKKRDDTGKYKAHNSKLGAKLRKTVGLTPYQKYYDLCEQIGVDLNGKLLEKLLRDYLTDKTGYNFDD